jgi:hypothetical protein
VPDEERGCRRSTPAKQARLDDRSPDSFARAEDPAANP